MTDEKNLGPRDRVPSMEEHAAHIEEMKVAEARLRSWLEGHALDSVEQLEADVRLMLERIDAYEASITWHTGCLNCPKLLDMNLAAHEALEKADALYRAANERRLDCSLQLAAYQDARAKVGAQNECRACSWIKETGGSLNMPNAHTCALKPEGPPLPVPGPGRQS